MWLCVNRSLVTSEVRLPGTSQLSTSEQSLAGRVGQHLHLLMRNISSLTRDCEEGCQWDDASYIDSLVRDTPAGLRQARLPCQYQNCVELQDDQAQQEHQGAHQDCGGQRTAASLVSLLNQCSLGFI